MQVTKDARGNHYVIRDDGLVKRLDEADALWVDLAARHTLPAPVGADNG